MATQAAPGTGPRTPLSRERVLRAAVDIADRGGIESLTMRNLAQELGAEAMSLYYHVANKEEVLDGIVDVIVGEINDVVDRIEVPSRGADWKKAVRQRILSAREVLLRHPWAPRVFETRTTTSPAVLHYFNALLGLMRDGGFSNDLAHHALHALGSRALGFSQELFVPGNDAQDEAATAVLAGMADRLPHLVGMMMEIAQAEFEFGLDVILDGLDRLRETA
jgi:AcrR family transcriptional regulator